MGLSKRAKRAAFLSLYEPSTEKCRIRMAVYSNKIRLMLYKRKVEIIETNQPIRVF